VLAGILRGEFHLAARHQGTGDILGRGRFRVQATWPDERSGPPIAITGVQRHYAVGNWGGGPPVAQNIKVLPAPENFRVALVLLETKDRSFGPDPSAVRAAWKDRLVGGTSVRTFYEETSLLGTPPGAFVKGTTVTLVGNRVFGPIIMPNGWGDYFKDREKPWQGWLPKDDARQAFAAEFCEVLMDEGISDPILRNTDAVVFLVRTASDNPETVGSKNFTAKFAWPSANGTFFNYKTEFAMSQRRIPVVVSPDDYPSGMPAADRFPWVAMLSHELGHNLGLEDLYDAKEEFPAEVDERAAGALDLMGDGWPHPDFSLPNRMRLGWIDPGWIERVDFATDPNGRVVTLQAASALARAGLPAGRKAGVEIRVRDGWNYYFEYRRTKAGRVADQALNAMFGASELIAGLDVMSSGTPEAARPIIERVPVDPDGDGPILNSTGEDFDDSDLTNSEGMHDFRLIFDQIDPADAEAARIKIEYVRARRPELQIRPAPGIGDWKSPDINIESKFGPNKVAKGLPNKVTITIRNAGVRAATQVRVRAKWLPFTLSSGGEWQQLTDPPLLDLGPGEQKDFVTNWEVPASFKIGDVEVEHFCIRADIDRYVDPTDPSASEIVLHNNWAQSNFDTNAVASGSPSDRIRTGVSLRNGLGRTATYLVDAVQDSRHFRIFIGSAWLRLAPDETRMVELAYETLAGDPVHGGAFAKEFGEHGLRDIDRVSVSSFLLPAEGMACRSPRLWWGVNLALRAGWRTSIGRIERTGEIITGFVESDAGGGRHGVSEGKLSLALWVDGTFDDRFDLTADAGPNGRFSVGLPVELLAILESGIFAEAEALFLGTQRYAPCRSGRQVLRR
jgi:M6 family metalloprotease-like protein